MEIVSAQQCLLFLLILASFRSCFGRNKLDYDRQIPHNDRSRLGDYSDDEYNVHGASSVEYDLSSSNISTRLNKSPHVYPVLLRTFVVTDFGAEGQGGDDTEAFRKTWSMACSNGGFMVVPPTKKFLVKPITFSGPCHFGVVLLIHGTIIASSQISDYEKVDRKYWLRFVNITNLSVEGGGTIDGSGQIWWQNSCKVNKSLPCNHAPTAVSFHYCNILRVKQLTLKNAQQMHLAFHNCHTVLVSHLQVISPGNSPNTDGIHLTGAQQVTIQNCVIKTGDDCISIVSGSSNVKATRIYCGPGHGISIGSLGANKASKDDVFNVEVDDVILSETTNGVRIKTWEGGVGFARNILFKNIKMHNVTNPIIIDQHYCDTAKKECPTPGEPSAVQVSNVQYINIVGTSASEVATNFNCSRSFNCQEITLKNVRLTQIGDEGAKAYCSNVKYMRERNVDPQCARNLDQIIDFNNRRKS